MIITVIIYNNKKLKIICYSDENLYKRFYAVTLPAVIITV
jgi:hypothetical protein